MADSNQTNNDNTAANDAPKIAQEHYKHTPAAHLPSATASIFADDESNAAAEKKNTDSTKADGTIEGALVEAKGSEKKAEDDPFILERQNLEETLKRIKRQSQLYKEEFKGETARFEDRIAQLMKEMEQEMKGGLGGSQSDGGIGAVTDGFKGVTVSEDVEGKEEGG